MARPPAPLVRRNWKGAWSWARQVAKGRWRVREYDPETDEYGPRVPLTPESLERIYPADIFVTHRRALEMQGGLP